MNNNMTKLKTQDFKCEWKSAVSSENKVKPSKRIWDQWLAGFVDADGCFLVSKAVLSCEVTTNIDDEPMLREIQKTLGGSVKSRSGSTSVRWRLTHRAGMRDLCQRVNGHIRYSVRYRQFEKVCDHLKMHIIPPVTLCKNSGYVAGLWDGNGSITIGVSKSSASNSVLPHIYGKMIRLIYSRGHHQLSIHIDSSEKALLDSCKSVLNHGSIISKNPYDNPKHRGTGCNGRCPHYRFYWTSFDDVNRWKVYLEKTKAGRSLKHRRLRLVHRYFKLKAQKAHLAEETSALWKRWRDFCHAWYNIPK